MNTWLLKGFMDSIPASLDEAAKVDGATEWDVFSKIIMPLARPILLVVFILSFVGLYNELLLATVLIRDVQQFTLPLGLTLFVESEYAAKWGQLSAAAVLGTAPILVLYWTVQDRIVGGLTGAVKGWTGPEPGDTARGIRSQTSPDGARFGPAVRPGRTLRTMKASSTRRRLSRRRPARPGSWRRP